LMKKKPGVPVTPARVPSSTSFCTVARRDPSGFWTHHCRPILRRFSWLPPPARWLGLVRCRLRELVSCHSGQRTVPGNHRCPDPAVAIVQSQEWRAPVDYAQGTAGTGQAPQTGGWLAKWWAPANRSTSSPVAASARAGPVRRAQAQKLQARSRPFSLSVRLSGNCWPLTRMWERRTISPWQPMVEFQWRS
jgi:hypothetical protein